MNPRFSLMTTWQEENAIPLQEKNMEYIPPQNEVTPLTKIDFPPIEEKKLTYSLGSNDYGVNMNVDVDGTRALINPTTGNLYSIVSDKYKVVPYEESLELVEEAIQANSEFGRYKRTLSFMNDGGRMIAKYRFTDHNIPIGKGDLVNPEIIVRRSYDTTWGFALLFGAFRMVCSNGLVIGEKILEYNHKHTVNLDLESVMKSLNGAIDKFSIQTRIWEKWVDRVTTLEDYERVMATMDFGKRHEEAVVDEVEVSSDVTLDDLKMKTLSYWLFFNIISQYVTHRIRVRGNQEQIAEVRRETFFDRMRIAFRE